MEKLKLSDLPIELFPSIKLYLQLADYHALLNTSKSEFGEIRQLTIFYALSFRGSHLFYANTAFRERILSSVRHPKKQLELKFHRKFRKLIKKGTLNGLYCLKSCSDCRESDISLLSNIECIEGLSRWTTLTSFPALPNLKQLSLREFHALNDVATLKHLQQLELWDCTQLSDISALRDIPQLSLVNCPNIQDFSCLGKQQQLTIRSCSGLHNVSNLRTVKRLRIAACDNVLDLSALDGVYHLELIDCPLITDISKIGKNHHGVVISRCAYHLKGYEVLEKVPMVFLEFCNIKDLTVLRGAESVTLVECNEVEDVAPLSGLKRLALEDCPLIADVNCLHNVPELNLCYLEGLMNYSRLGNHQKLSLTAMEDMKEFDFLSSVKELHIEEMDMFFLVLDWKVHLLTNLHFLQIDCCKGITHVNGLGDIHTVYLDYLDIQDIRGFGRNRCVRISYCDELNDVSSLATVPIVSIIRCENVVDISCLQKVPKLLVVPTVGVKV